MTKGGELFKLAREKHASENQILDSVRESVLAELEGLASEAKQFVQQFEARIAAIVDRARGLVDSSAEALAKADSRDKLEPGGRLPQGSSLADMDKLDRELNAILEGGRIRTVHEIEARDGREIPPRPEIIAVRDGRD